MADELEQKYPEILLVRGLLETAQNRLKEVGGNPLTLGRVGLQIFGDYLEAEYGREELDHEIELLKQRADIRGG